MISLLLSALSLLQATSAAPPAPGPDVLDARRGPAAYAEAWTAIDRRIRRQFYARVARREQMNALLAKYAPIAKAAVDDDQFARRVERMIREFGDSHFDYYTKSDQGYYLMDSLSAGDKSEMEPMVGAWFQRTPSGFVVQMVLEGGQAALAGVRQGDLAVSADDAPFGPIASFQGKIGKPVNVLFRRGDKEFRCNLTPVMERPQTAFLDASKASARAIKSGPETFGYVHLWTQSDDKFKDLLANLVSGRFANTDAFILDLRDGFGGRPEGYADPFFRPDVSIAWNYGGARPSVEHFGYGKPLVVLINKGSRSAKELLSYILKTSKRATLIGTTTAGNVLGTFPMRISPWSILEMPIADVEANGVRLEKRGVDPNIVVPDGYAPDGTDRVIDRAVEFLAGSKPVAAKALHK